MRSLFVPLWLATVWCATDVFAHCEIPCGIYGDDARFASIFEDIETIQKSMTQIDRLSDSLDNINQLTRWVNNKETHANHVQEVVTQYFMTQRVKLPDFSDEAAVTSYRDKVALLHQMLVYAMKCKQTTDLANAERLHELTHLFKESYTK